jgi:lipopolysaccharide transport system ATP-binding protein
MGEYAIRVSGLGKRYNLGRRARYHTLRDTLAEAVRAPLRWCRTRSPGEGENGEGYLWALRDVTFDVPRGSVLGVVGGNGAGKSTLFKVLSRITDPTCGEAEVNGRMSSLLEIGTGFHPELTGRENVYLNGAVLGMKKHEVTRKFDSIVAFADVDQFIDTPVKYYSSGMYMRLAFSVAAHLDSDILLVDEVLAVGDAQFQKKCLGQMKETVRSGRTILFVSHNMGAVRQLCPTSVWLRAGRVAAHGDTSSVLSEYLKKTEENLTAGATTFREEPGKEVQLRRAATVNVDGTPAVTFDCDSEVVIELLLQVRRVVPGLYAYLEVLRSDGTQVMVSDSFDCPPNPLEHLEPGTHVLRVVIPPRTLGTGDYTVYLSFSSSSSLGNTNVDSPGTVCTFQLEDHSSRRGNQRGGYFSTLLQWQVNRSAGDLSGRPLPHR